MEPTGTPEPPHVPAADGRHPQAGPDAPADPEPARRDLARRDGPGGPDADLVRWAGEVDRDRTGDHREREHRHDDREHGGRRDRRDRPHRDEPPHDRPVGAWARLRARGWRVAIGAGIGAAALLLIPFFLFPTLDLDEPVDQWWPPFAVGLGTLAVLSILRIDRLLKGWTWHVAGLAFVAALVLFTAANPWAWAFAASLGLLVAGLLRLPDRRLATVAAGLLVVSIVGFAFRASDIAEQQARISAHAGDESRAVLGGVDDAEKVPPLLDRAISGSVPDPAPVCRILSPEAERALVAQLQAPDCTAAVTAVHARYARGGMPAPVTAVPRAAEPMTTEPGYTLDTCSSAWAAAAGPQLGKVVVGWTSPTARRYAVTGFQSC